MKNSKKNSTKYKKKILILGSLGMLGHMLHDFLKKKYVVKGLCRKKRNVLKKYIKENNFITIDLLKLQELEKIILKFKPDIVINCAGIIKQKTNKFDKDNIFFINSCLPNYLSILAIKEKFKLIHISTDCVFNGIRGNYKEFESPNSLDDYGLSKSLGEVSSINSITLRTSIIGHEIYEQNGLLEWFLKQTKICGYKNAFFSGVTTLELSKIIEKVLNSNLKNGIYNVASKKISKYRLLLLIKKIYAKNTLILPSSKFKIDRSLNGTFFKKMTNITVSSWEEMIIDQKMNYLKKIKIYEYFQK